MKDADMLKKIDHKIHNFREDRYTTYGGLQMVFVGNFCQLPPINKENKSLYFDLRKESWMDAINHYIECKGKDRFKNDSEWGEILYRFREGAPLPSNFHEINKCVCYPI